MQPIQGSDFDVCFRWWGKNVNGELMELDIVGESLNKKYLLVGECKWSKIKSPNTLIDNLTYKASLLPDIEGKTIIPMLFVKELENEAKKPENIFTPEVVLARLMN